MPAAHAGAGAGRVGGEVSFFFFLLLLGLSLSRKTKLTRPLQKTKTKNKQQQLFRCRFCQQCGRFQPLGEFEGLRRSCREKLDAHNARRKRVAVVAGGAAKRSKR